MSSKHFGEGFEVLTSTEHISSLMLSMDDTNLTIIIDNIPGKQSSVKILYNIANNQKISSQEARHGLSLFGDYYREEKQQPGSHPNIRLLLDIIENDETWTVEAHQKKN